MKVGSPARLAEDLLAELGMTTPEDIDVDAIAYWCGALVTYAPLTGCDGRILGGRGRAIITVNEDASQGRRRFTAAHETAHWIYDKGKVEGACTEEKITRAWGASGREQRANKFAAELLLPRSMVATHLSGAPLNLDTVRSVASRFDVSLTAAAIRIVKLSSRPSMIICMSSRGREWFFRSPLVPETLWPVKALQPGARLQTLTRRVGSFDGGFVAADIWTDRDDGDEYELHEDTVMVTDDLSLTIISWPDEGQIVALMDTEG